MDKTKRNRERLFWIAIYIVILGVPAFIIASTQIRYSWIDESEANTIVVHYKKHGGGGDLLISFSDHEDLHYYWNRNNKVGEKLRKCEPGTELTIKTHPTSDIIMSIRTPETEILAFDEALQEMKSERTHFVWLIAIVFCPLYLILIFSTGTSQIAKRKKKGHPIDGFIIKRG